ncbi:hypothetical protein [Tropicimonas isoalkanivorans]|uniref:Uncharacterized protein n=1 Tax=Tropicimonas isoalkanivorans TaxID=441112 RepID=A0A1I1E1Z5_9RHOB|nr:hypothetical protein [Tropicimonas isoalkanivorans]SFB81201.1 hypothetical protein SAMN04488094_101594 [Tropicimonas isoalkanivorans]
MRSTVFAAAFASGFAVPTHAGQPLYESLVECSVLIDLLMGEQSFQPGQNEMLDLYAAASNAMRAEALRRSSEDYVVEMSDQIRTLWHERWEADGWDDPGKRGALIEWWTYCFKLADHLELTPETPSSSSGAQPDT